MFIIGRHNNNVPAGSIIYFYFGAIVFADTAIPILVQKMVLLGANKRALTAKIAGGARMFSTASNNSLSNIGQRNVVAVKGALAKLGIPIIAEDTGKDYGRTLFFTVEDGIMHIKSAKCGEWHF